jgi:hypothetical protein
MLQCHREEETIELTEPTGMCHAIKFMAKLADFMLRCSLELAFLQQQKLTMGDHL